MECKTFVFDSGLHEGDTSKFPCLRGISQGGSVWDLARLAGSAVLAYDQDVVLDPIDMRASEQWNCYKLLSKLCSGQGRPAWLTLFDHCMRPGAKLWVTLHKGQLSSFANL